MISSTGTGGGSERGGAWVVIIRRHGPGAWARRARWWMRWRPVPALHCARVLVVRLPDR